MTGSEFYEAPLEEQTERMTAFARTALARWPGSWGEPKLIKFRENAVFAVADETGRRVVLRIHRHEYHTDSELLSELQWMQALRGAGVIAPEVVPSRAGSNFETVASPEIPESRQVDILSWVPGRPVGAVEDMADVDAATLEPIYRRIGELAALVHHQAKSWRLPEGFTRHAWDEAGLIGPEPFWGRFMELAALTEAQRSVLRRACDRASGDLARIGQGSDCYGLIHADMVPENVFVDEDRLGLIDFDDAGFGWHMFELATALLFYLDHPGYDRIRDALFSGYEAARPGCVDGTQLPLFLFLRSTTYLGWVHTRSETPTARELTPYVVELALRAAEDYLSTDAAAAS